MSQQKNTTAKKQVQLQNFRKAKKEKEAIKEKGVAKKLVNQGKVKRSVKYDPKAADVRNAATTITLSNEKRLTNVNPSVVYEVPIQIESLFAPAIAAVSYALQRGWAVSTPNPSYPFWAFGLLCQQLIDYATTGKVSTSHIPYWLAYIGQSFIEKRVKMGQGFVTYKYTLDQAKIPSNFPALIAMGAFTPNNLARHWNVGAVNIIGEGTEPVNKFFSTVQTTGFTYAEEDGQKAWSSLIQFLANVHKVSDPRHAMHKLIPSNLVLSSTYDPSAYSLVKAQPGGGYAGVGSWFGTNELEVPILTPLLARFKSPVNSNGYDPVRFPRHSVMSSMDGIASSGAFLHLLGKKTLRTKHCMIPKCIDFYQICETVFLWLRETSRLKLEDPGNVAESVKPGVGGIASETLPLTMQEVMILLRSTCMNLYKDTQFLAQGTFPCAITSNSQQGYTALISAVGTYPAQSAEIELPLILVENLRSTTYRVNFPDKVFNEKTGKFEVDAHNPQIYVPILMAPNTVELRPEDYDIGWTDIDGQVHTVPLFASSATAFATEDYTKTPSISRKSSKTHLVGAEVPISMIDGSTADQFVAINDPTALQDLVDVWNTWVRDHANYSVPLTTIGSDGGINSLEVITMTEHWIEQQFKPQKRELLPRFKLIAKDTFNLGPYAAKGLVVLSSQTVPDAATWDTLQQFWLKPVNHDAVITAGDPKTYTKYERMQIASLEPATLIKVETNMGAVYSQKNYELALLNTRSKDQPKTEAVNFLESEAAKGRGGILSSLAASFLGNDTAKQLASFLPI